MRFIICMLAALCVVAGPAYAQEDAVKDRQEEAQEPKPPQGPARWEHAIQAFEAASAENPPPENALLFAGSSSIRGWDLERFFPGRVVLNRGFGGSQTSDLVHFVNRVVTNHHPRAIVVYEGDNDIASGKTPETVFADFLTLCERIHDKVSDAPILFLAIKPSIARWELWPEIQRANALIETHAAGTPLVRYVDIAPATLGEDGKPDPALFVEDGLHMSEAGYRAWAEVLDPFLDAAMRDTRRD